MFATENNQFPFYPKKLSEKGEFDVFLKLKGKALLDYIQKKLIYCRRKLFTGWGPLSKTSPKILNDLKEFLK